VAIEEPVKKLAVAVERAVVMGALFLDGSIYNFL
jgi:hypothetical protein